MATPGGRTPTPVNKENAAFPADVSARGSVTQPLPLTPVVPPAPPEQPNPPKGNGPSVEERLFEEGYAFDFFQAVRILERLAPARRAVGRGGPPGVEAVRFRAHLSLSFPPSAIYEV